MIGGAVLISGNGSEVLTWLAESRTGTATISERTAGNPVRIVIGSLVRVQVKWRIFPESRDQKFRDRRTHIHLISTHRADSEERCFTDDYMGYNTFRCSTTAELLCQRSWHIWQAGLGGPRVPTNHHKSHSLSRRLCIRNSRNGSHQETHHKHHSHHRSYTVAGQDIPETNLRLRVLLSQNPTRLPGRRNSNMENQDCKILVRVSY